MTNRPYILGAVAYDAKVVPIWEGFKTYFEARGLPFDFVLFSNYERQVEAHLRGELDVAWNSPLAWLETEQACARRNMRAHAIAMRDTDCDLTSVVLVRANGPADIGALRGKRFGVGAKDSPQATLIPLIELADRGVEGPVTRHDVLVGKHGDHIGGERDAVKALLAGTVDAACLIDGNRLAFANEGLFAPADLRVVLQTAPYDHCNFTVITATASDKLSAQTQQFRELLLAMSYEDPQVRPLLDMEGLRAWRPGRTSGYKALARAIDRFGTIREWLSQLA